jgi:hypothetical protein
MGKERARTLFIGALVVGKGEGFRCDRGGKGLEVRVEKGGVLKEGKVKPQSDVHFYFFELL